VPVGEVRAASGRIAVAIFSKSTSLFPTIATSQWIFALACARNYFSMSTAMILLCLALLVSQIGIALAWEPHSEAVGKKLVQDNVQKIA